MLQSDSSNKSRRNDELVAEFKRARSIAAQLAVMFQTMASNQSATNEFSDKLDGRMDQFEQRFAAVEKQNDASSHGHRDILSGVDIYIYIYISNIKFPYGTGRVAVLHLLPTRGESACPHVIAWYAPPCSTYHTYRVPPGNKTPTHESSEGVC